MKTRFFVYLFVCLTLTYFAFAMLLPTDPHVLEKYQISQARARLLNLTVVIPLMAVWLSALYGYVRFKTYALLVNDSPEGKPLNRLANGLMVLALSLPITSIMSTVFGYITARHADLLPATSIIRNYAGLCFSVIAFIIIAQGAKGLLQTFRAKKAYPLLLSNYTVAVVILLSSLFTWLVTSQPLGPEIGRDTYYLPNWILVTTIAVPYLFAWYRGASGAYQIYLYKGKVKGSVYKQAFRDLALGIGVIVSISILIQLITTLSTRLNRLNLTPILLIIYLLIALYAVGFGLVARGAKKLKKIEEV